MVFSSTFFIFFFLPTVLLVYFAASKKLKNFILFLFSLLFYSWGEPVYILIMLFSTVFDYANGLMIDRFYSKGKCGAAKMVLICSVVVNLGILGFFKYHNFFIENINALTGSNLSLINIALPIGISFYTFQTMSYTIDVYRREVSAQRNIISFGAYVTMFPQLVAGPIVQYKDIETQLNSRQITASGFFYGIKRFVIGLAKKVLLANNIGLLWEQISGGSLSSLSVNEAWLGAIAFSFQIFFDFSGYSDMAIGLGEMFGFHFKENFNYPYCSKSITEFWRRWHISLGSWFREYVYIPLGGNRKGLKRQLFNILIVWCLTGFWHGASWNFVIWGLYFGVLLIIEKVFLLKWLSRHKILSRIYTLVFVIISWVIFAFDDISNVGLYLKAMLGLNGAGIFSSVSFYYLNANAIVLIACAVFSIDLFRRQKQRSKINAFSYIVNAAKFAVYAAVFFISVSFLVGDTYNPFLYFRF